MIIMKFGGASVATPESFELVSDLIARRREDFSRIAVVVSAMGDATDDLVALALKINPTPPQREYDMLVSVGERISISLLAMALAKRGIEAVSFTGSQAGVITTSRHTEARIVEVRPKRLLPLLETNKVVIVAGFQGMSREGEITTLGRGGSDTTAVALGVAFGAPVEFYKDVKGIYDQDPKKNSSAKLLKNLSYEQALDIVQHGAEVLHPRCIELAQKNQIQLHVRSFISCNFNEDEGTKIGPPGLMRIANKQYEDD